MELDLEKYRPWIYGVAICLLLPALLINLGLMTFIDDEGIRSLVALEMKLSGNYITPTLHGEYYYKKPPLFNWILLLFFELAGRFDEFVARLPTVLALVGYAGTIFFFFRKHYDTKTAFLNAFVFVTCGRVLFWDSMLALIDITFSWVVFTSFMIIYHAFEQQRFWRLFLLSYFLTAIGFLLKGLPAVVFQGITLVVYFAYKGQFKRLFSIAHISGGLVFVLLVGGYYLVYSQFNQSLDSLFGTLFLESSKRTVVNYGWGYTILHLFTFPFEMVYHFLPWSLLIIYFFRKDIVKLIRQDGFMTFNLLTFLANIVIYWSSPEVYPRYLLMLAPLLFSNFIYLHFIHREENTWQYRFLDKLFLIVILFIAIGSFAPLFLERISWVELRIPKTLAIGFSLLALAYLFYRGRRERLLVMVLFLLIVRVGFNWFVLPDRNANDFGDLCRVTSKEAGDRFKDREMYLYKDIEMQMTNSFYLTERRRRIVTRKMDNFDPDAVFIIDPKATFTLKYNKLGEFRLRHEQRTYEVVELKK